MTEIMCSNKNDNMKKMCRLCLANDDTLTNMFTFSSKLGVLIADVVMKCATIHVIQEDDMPDSVCGLCYTELERIHRFQTRAVQADKTLRCRLKQEQSDTSVRKMKKIFGEVTFKSENILDNKDFYQVNVKNENSNYITKDQKNISVDQVIKLETEFIIKEEPINCNEMDTNNEEDIVNDNEETNFGFLEPNDNIKSEHTESSAPQFDIIEPFNEFREQKHKKTPFQCSVCKQFFQNKYQLVKHRSTHPRKRQRFPCDLCKRVFRLRNRLVFHRFSHEKEQNCCDVCDQRFKSRYFLNLHKLTHAEEQPHRCSLCNKTFKGSSTLKNHLLWHTADKPHHCHICDDQFRHLYNLRVHLSLIHGTQKI